MVRLLDVGSWESGRPDQLEFDPGCYCGVDTTVSGTGASATVKYPSTAHKLSGWPEYYFDVRTNSSCKENVRSVMAARFALAASNGCDGIEPDNTDAFHDSGKGVAGGGWNITAADQNDYNLWVAETVHSFNMAVLSKVPMGYWLRLMLQAW